MWIVKNVGVLVENTVSIWDKMHCMVYGMVWFLKDSKTFVLKHIHSTLTPLLGYMLVNCGVQNSNNY